MDIKDLIGHAFNGEAKEFEETFSSLMSERLEDAISNKYNEMFGNVSEAKDEEDEDEDKSDKDDSDESDEEEDEDEDED